MPKKKIPISLLQKAKRRIHDCCGVPPILGKLKDEDEYITVCPKCCREYKGSLGTIVYYWNYDIGYDTDEDG